MKHCTSCGSKIKEEDLFCTNCGAKQVQANNSAQTQSEQFVNQPIAPVRQEPFNTYNYNNVKSQINFSAIGYTLLSMLTKPVTGAKQFTEKGEKSSVLSITILLALMQGLLGIWKVSETISSLQKVAMDFMKRISAFMGIIEPGSTSSFLNSSDILEITTEINKVKSLIDIPYGKIFMQNIALFLISIAILFIILYLMTNILSRNKGDAFKIYKTVLIVSVPTLYFQLFSIILSYLSLYAGMGIAIIGVIISLSSLAIVTKESLNIDANHSAFIVAIAAIVVIIGNLICVQNFLPSNISDIIMSATNVMKNLN